MDDDKAREEEEDKRREAAIASAAALKPNFTSAGVTKAQLSKLQELHRKRLQIKAKSKKHNKKPKGNEFHWKYGDDKGRLADDSDYQEGSSVSDPATSKKNDNVATDLGVKTRQKLHWGLDVKERWERKANM